ncbi:hypothetical protein [Clostridium felsineum]|uniref:hypothetical protein n=1 Tax=Clostridium felsineum TaxID=36839 RepID=UPI0009C86F0D|nr:hypothetical protein [Clostridium felsineum]URZ02571.1 hypothetical protein CLAUR_025830 [Clostridium felsineum]
MGLASEAVLYRGNDDEDLNKELKETDDFLKKINKEEMGNKAWYNMPAKEDIFDKIEYWFTGKKPRVKTQGEEVIAAQYTEMAFSNQNFAMELQSEFETGYSSLRDFMSTSEVTRYNEYWKEIGTSKAVLARDVKLAEINILSNTKKVIL